jgi:energy-coupling factor transporter ATP-binding protein EcfA2
MKIIEFRAERFKRLSAVEITPEGNTVIISGRNGQGKSSVLDAIWLALGGGNATKDSATTVPIKEGEKDAVVRLDLGDMVVTRKWTTSGSTLTVEGADGRKYSSPQTLLDTLVGTISFDPLSFAKMPPMEQRSQLIDLVKLPVDLDELSAQRKAFYDQRTFVNRELKTIQAELAGIQLPDNDVPEEEISIAEMTKKIGMAQDQRSRIIMGRQRLQEKVEKGKALRELIQQKTEELTALANQIRSETEILESCKEPDVQAMRSQLENAEQINKLVRQKKHKAELQVRLNDKTTESDGITQQIESIDRTKKEAFLNVRFPVDGLAVDEEGITYNGIPFRQCSSAEQLKVCVAIASALNPEIRVIRVPDASLLDEESMKVMQDLAQQQDIQIWMERVTDGKEKVGVVIEDGAVKQ